jgi:hypothetical protein
MPLLAEHVLTSDLATDRSRSGGPGQHRGPCAAANLGTCARCLDATASAWPLDKADAVVASNMIHISPWTASRGLMSGAARLLPAGGALYLYGPFKENGAHTAPSNAAFDTSLRARDPQWGVRDAGDVMKLATGHGFEFVKRVPMPANNLSLVFRRARRDQPRDLLRDDKLRLRFASRLEPQCAHL